MQNKRPSPTSIRLTHEHRELITNALKVAGINRNSIGWFPRLLIVVFRFYLDHSVGAK